MRKENRSVRYKILTIDPYLEPYYTDIALRMKRNLDIRQKLLGNERELSTLANGYLYFGFNRTADGWTFREWLPGADEVFLIGDFNSWNHTSHPLKRIEGGIWEIELMGADSIRHGQYVKLLIRRGKETFERIPAYMRRVEMDDRSKNFCGRIWRPTQRFLWTDGNYKKHKPANPVIYEVHIGISSEKEAVSSYREFADTMLKYISDMGYNTILLMAVQAHPYYASYGYQVTNFFAASARYGTPEDLKYLINKAHGMNLTVLLDIVHSQASGNVGEGLDRIDGTDDLYFLPGDKGMHPVWRTRLFDYSRHQVIHFLLSNLKFWQEEYHFDGFRFTGVTSMMFHNHGISNDFKTYDQYFSMNTNLDAVTYLQLASELVHDVNPFAIMIAEDSSGIPGMCIPVRSGGIGFDYALTSQLPTYWTRLLRDTRDENWDIYNMWYELTRRRPQEKNIGCCETHEESMVGNCTLIRLMAGEELYSGMRKDYHSPRIDRAIDLHKMFRFATLILASDGYLDFMGNEFGHPDWVDLPREGNQFSYKYARRQWSLVHNEELKYEWLSNFTLAMQRFVRKYRVLSKSAAVNSAIDQERKILSFVRGDLYYIFNFNTTVSVPNYRADTTLLGKGEYRAVFSSDAVEFGGQDRVSMDTIYHAVQRDDNSIGFDIYLPCRTAVVLKRSKD